MEEGEEEEEELLGHLVTEDKLAKDAERTATEVAAATAGGGGGGDGAEEGARIARRHSSVPSLDLSAVVNARPPAGKDEEDVASKMAKLSLSARRELALKEAPEGLSLMEGSDAFADGVPQGECTVHFPDGSKCARSSPLPPPARVSPPAARSVRQVRGPTGGRHHFRARRVRKLHGHRVQGPLCERVRGECTPPCTLPVPCVTLSSGAAC